MSALAERLGFTEVEANLVLSLIVILLLALVWFVIVRLITRRVDDAGIWYLTRKASSYGVVVVGLIALIAVWVDTFRELGTFLGLVGGGIAIALSDLLRNIAGWMYVVVRRPFRVDDRIEIDGVRGDVIDIRLFRTTLLEIGNWVDADQSTGRIVHVPNGKVLSTSVFNATEGFGFLWHELPVYLTYESDWRRGEELLLEALEAAAGHTAEDAQQRIKRASRAYRIRYTHLTPTVYVSVRDRGVLLTGRILVDARRRRGVEQQVWRQLLDAIGQEPRVTLAYPTERRVLHMAPPPTGGPGDPASPPEPTGGPGDPASPPEPTSHPATEPATAPATAPATHPPTHRPTEPMTPPRSAP